MRDCGEPGIGGDGARRRGGARSGKLDLEARRAPRVASPRRGFRVLADELSDAIFRHDANKRLVCSNAACRRYFPREAGIDGALLPLAVFPPAKAQIYDSLLERVLETGEPAQFEVRLTGMADDQGRPIDLSIALQPERNAAGRVNAVLAVARDVSALKRAIADAEAKMREFESVFDATPDIVVRYDRDLRSIYRNPAAARATPPPKGALGQHSDEAARVDDPPEYIRHLRDCLETKRLQKFEIAVRDVAGGTRRHHILMAPEFDPAGAAIGVLAIGRDLTELANANRQARFLATHDPLTGLPNRLRLAEELSRAIREHEATGRGFALLYLDLDDFKQINDSLGHELGDELLRQTAQRIADSVGDAGLTARAGGDEFAVILKDGADLDAVRKIAARDRRTPGVDPSASQPVRRESRRASARRAARTTTSPCRG